MKNTSVEPKINSKLFIYSNILLAVFILSIVGFIEYKSREQLISEARDQVENYSKIIEESMLASLTGIEVVLDQFANEVEKVGSPNKLSDHELIQLKSNIQKMSSLNLSWADADGNMQWYSAYSREEAQKQKLNFADRDYFIYLKNHQTNETVITEPYFGRVRKKWVIILARRLQNKDGRFLGVAWCSIGQDFFEEMRQKIKLGPDDVFVVATGKVLKFMYRYPHIENITGTEYIPPENAQQVFKHEQHNGVFDVISPRDSHHRISAFSWIGNKQVYTVIGKDFDRLLIPWKKQFILSLFLTSIVILVSSLLTYYFLRAHKNFRIYQMKLANSAKFVAIGEMSGSIAHEINNPLAIISGLAKKIERLIDQDQINPQEIKLNISKINQTVERISNTIKGLRKISNQSDMSSEAIQIDAVINEMIFLSQERFRNLDIKINTDLNCENRLVRLNEAQLMQVLINLLNNSSDHIASLPERWIQISSQVVNQKVIIKVTDSGDGIPEEIAAMMMTPFFTTKAIGKGSGLGLSISKQIIEAHGGQLYYNKDSKNTQFIIELLIESK